MNISLLVLVAALGQADPPRVEQPDPPRLARRVAELESRVQRLETALGIASFPAETVKPIGSTGPGMIGTQPEYRFPIRPVEATAPAPTFTYQSAATCSGPNCSQATQATQWQPFGGLFRRR